MKKNSLKYGYLLSLCVVSVSLFATEKNYTFTNASDRRVALMLYDKKSFKEAHVHEALVNPKEKITVTMPGLYYLKIIDGKDTNAETRKADFIFIDPSTYVKIKKPNVKTYKQPELKDSTAFKIEKASLIKKGKYFIVTGN